MTFNGTITATGAITFEMPTTTFNGIVAVDGNAMSGSFVGSNNGEEWAGNWTMNKL